MKEACAALTARHLGKRHVAQACAMIALLLGKSLR